MSFRLDTLTTGSGLVILCEGHLDAQALAAIERERAAAEAAGLQVVVRLCRGATADRSIVNRLAAYASDRLEVESPFLRTWLDALRTSHSLGD